MAEKDTGVKNVLMFCHVKIETNILLLCFCTLVSNMLQQVSYQSPLSVIFFNLLRGASVCICCTSGVKT